MRSIVSIAKSNRKNAALFKRVVVAVTGALVFLAGVVLLVLPGPGLVVIVIGLAILGREFHWAKASSEKLRRLFKQIRAKLQRRSQGGI